MARMPVTSMMADCNNYGPDWEWTSSTAPSSCRPRSDKAFQFGFCARGSEKVGDALLGQLCSGLDRELRVRKRLPRFGPEAKIGPGTETVAEPQQLGLSAGWNLPRLSRVELGLVEARTRPSYLVDDIDRMAFRTKYSYQPMRPSGVVS